MNIHIFDLSYETSNNNANIFCQIASVYPIKKIIGKTKVVQVSNKILWNESFTTNDIFMKNVKFVIYKKSDVDGILSVCDFIYQVSSSSSSNKNGNKITLENVENKIKLTFSITKMQNSIKIRDDIIESNINPSQSASQNKYEIHDFLSFSVISKKMHQIALIHVSSDQKTVQISCPHFSYIKPIHFRSDSNATSALIDVGKTFPTFQFFFIAFHLQKSDNEKIENESVEISFYANSDFKQIFSKKINGENGENLYVPVFFTFSSNNNSTFCEINSIDKLFENTLIGNLYQKQILGNILKSKNLCVENIYNGALFTGCLQLPKDLNILQLFLKHSSNEKIDMSFNTIKEGGSLDDTCFFNRQAILNKSIKISIQQYHSYVENSIIDFSILPPKINSIMITLTSFTGSPLSKISLIEIALTDGNENLITSIPVTIDDDLSGFVVGAIQKNSKGWEFKYIGYSCDCKMPNLAAKAFLSTCCSIDDDSVEWRDDV